MRQAIALLGRLTDETISEEAKTEFLQAFRSWKRG
jgi:hypothetical protein